jgi:hypothetical protein
MSSLQISSCKNLEGGGAYILRPTSRKTPVLVNLDKILISPKWGEQFPLYNSVGLIRIGSDHAPIMLDFGEGEVVRRKLFYFEKQWLLDPDFKEKVFNNIDENFPKTDSGVGQQS